MMLFKLPNKKNAEEEGLITIKISNLSSAGWKEKDLENLLANNITQLIKEEHLMTIGQEKPMKEEPDILALDNKGILHIFELKRHRADESNLLQVLRYGQKFGIYNYDRLNNIYNTYHKDSNRRSLQEDHEKYFSLEKILLKDEFNKEQKFVIVTDGIDIKTLRAIKYWKEKGLPIGALIYTVYKIGEDYIMDFDPYGPGDEFEIAETKNHVVNTNWTWNKKCYKEMIDEEKAAAYGDRKTAVDSIQKKDRVFLYHTGVGICAVGRAIGEMGKKDRWDKKHYEHYIPCRFHKKIDPVKKTYNALSAGEINQELGTRYSFRQTRFCIDDEVATKIEKMFREKELK